MNNTSSQPADATYLSFEGILDGEQVSQHQGILDTSLHYTLDFGGVTDILFSAQRALLRLRQAGHHLVIINACDKVAEKMEDSGVSTLIAICRKPKTLHIEQYEEFGASFMSKAYYSNDGDSILKVYGERSSLRSVVREKVIAKAVMLFGIPTPLVGTIYGTEGHIGIDFERIVGKRSFARIISQEPDRLEEIARRFAEMCKQLHSTPCDTSIFSNRETLYREQVVNCPDISNTARQGLLAFLDKLPHATTCLHGDMQIGNVIRTADGDDLWIDLADFGYGNPLLDIGMFYFQMRMHSEEQTQELYHITKEQTRRVWDVFVESYFGAFTPAQRNAVELQSQQLCALHMAYLSVYGPLMPFMVDFINRQFA